MTKTLVCHHFFVAKVFSQCVTSNRCFDQHNALQHLSILSFFKEVTFCSSLPRNIWFSISNFLAKCSFISAP